MSCPDMRSFGTPDFETSHTVGKGGWLKEALLGSWWVEGGMRVFLRFCRFFSRVCKTGDGKKEYVVGNYRGNAGNLVLQKLGKREARSKCKPTARHKSPKATRDDARRRATDARRLSTPSDWEGKLWLRHILSTVASWRKSWEDFFSKNAKCSFRMGSIFLTFFGRMRAFCVLSRVCRASVARRRASSRVARP